MWRFILEALYAYRLPKKTTSPRAGSTAGVRIALSINAAALSELDTRSILTDTWQQKKKTLFTKVPVELKKYHFKLERHVNPVCKNLDLLTARRPALWSWITTIIAGL